MCDDYDTDLDSEEDEFGRDNLIDDIKKIRLALADSDVEDNEDDEEEEEDEENAEFIETSSFRYHHLSSTSIDTQTKIIPESNTQPTLTELVPVTTDNAFKNEQKEQANESGFLDNNKNSGKSCTSPLSVRPGPSGCHGNLLEPTDYTITPVLTSYNEQPTSGATTIVPVTMATDDAYKNITQEQAIYNFAAQQQGIAGYLEELHEGVEVQDNVSNEMVITDVGVGDDVDVGSLGLRDTISLSLAQNREYQSQILNQLQSIDSALIENHRKQFSLNQAKVNEEDEIQQALPSLVKFSFPYFRDSDGHGPPDNEDAKYLRSFVVTGAYQTKSKAWNAKEEKLLAEGVRMQNLKNKLQPLLKSLKEAQNKLDIDPVVISLLNKQIKEIRELSPRALEEDLDGLDWDKLSAEYLPKRQAIECKLHWLHFGHPRVNKKTWTKHEDKMLLQLAKDKNHDEINWNDVAQTIQTNRTPLHCYQRFQRSLNKEILRSKWTPEEDEQLTELVKTFGEGNWQRIADYLDGRMGEQCMHRYMKACKPARKGRWTDEENEKLKEAVRSVGQGNWEKVAEYVPGRTGTQCRERFVNVINPNLKKGIWDKEEDAKLLKLVERFGEGCWSNIAKEMITRSDNQCWRRWNALRKEDSMYYKLNTLRKKREMVSNFVGRRQEKPSLRPEDLDIQDVPIILPSRPQPKEPKKRKNKRIKAEKLDTEDVQDNNKNREWQPSSASFEPQTAPPTSLNDNHAKPTDDHVTSSETNHVTPTDQRNCMKERRVVKRVIKRRESESSESDEEWNEGFVIDTSDLRNRASTRKRKNVSYVMEEDFVSDFSQDEEDEEDEKEREEGEGQEEVEEGNSQELEEQDKQVGQVKQATQTNQGSRKRVTQSRAAKNLQNASNTSTKSSNLAKTTTAATATTAATTAAATTAAATTTAATTTAATTTAATTTAATTTAATTTAATTTAATTTAATTTAATTTAATTTAATTTAATTTAATTTAATTTAATTAATTTATKVRSPIKVQGSVASFSLLLQAFNINISGVLQKVKPTPSQHAMQGTNQNSIVSNQLGKDSMSTNIASQQSPIVSSTPNKDNSSQASKKSEASQITGQQSFPVSLTPNKDKNASSQSLRRASIQSPGIDAEKSQAKQNVGNETPKKPSDKNESVRYTLRSPSKRKATTPRRTRRTKESETSIPPPSEQSLSHRIENIILKNNRILSSNKITKKSLTKDEKSKIESNKEATKTSTPKRPTIPFIPPLPPCFTTLKGFKNLWGMKGQLELLARQVNTVSSTSNEFIASGTKSTYTGVNIPSTTGTASCNTPSNSSQVNTSLSRSKVTTSSKGTTASTHSTSTVKTTSNIESVPISTSVGYARSTRSRSGVMKTSSKTTSSVVSALPSKQVHKSKNGETNVDNQEFTTPTTSSSGLVPIATYGIGTSSKEDKSSGSGETAIVRPESSVLASLPRVDPRFSQDPFVKYFLYRKAPEYKLLTARFNSLFLWPMLMSKSPLTGKTPRGLITSGRRQQNWGFPHMFAVPGTSTPSIVSNPRAETASSVVDRSFPPNAINPSSRSKRPEYPKDKNTNHKSSSERTASKSPRNRKRGSRKSSSAACDDDIPRKKRRERACRTEKNNE